MGYKKAMKSLRFSFNRSTSFLLFYVCGAQYVHSSRYALRVLIILLIINVPYIVFCSDLNVLDKSGRTPIHNAILGRHVKIMEMLLDAGADTTVLDESQSAPLHYAVRTRDENIVKVGTFEPHLTNI